MSSPLDGRMRAIAREEAATLLGGSPVSPGLADGLTASDWRAEMQQQITDLHEHLHHAATTIKHLEDRVDTLEKTATAPTQRRGSRKTSTGESGE